VRSVELEDDAILARARTAVRDLVTIATFEIACTIENLC
jgi:hypothetical protein